MENDHIAACIDVKIESIRDVIRVYEARIKYEMLDIDSWKEIQAGIVAGEYDEQAKRALYQKLTGTIIMDPPGGT
jgi:hypothetical protein